MENNFKMGVTEIRAEGREMDLSDSGWGQFKRSYGHSNDPSGFIKGTTIERSANMAAGAASHLRPR
jgi:hypothetical protein